MNELTALLGQKKNHRVKIQTRALGNPIKRGEFGQGGHWREKKRKVPSVPFSGSSTAHKVKRSWV